MAEAPPTCPHLVTTDEGTTYCGLAESTILEQIVLIEDLRDRLSVYESQAADPSKRIPWAEVKARLDGREA